MVSIGVAQGLRQATQVGYQNILAKWNAFDLGNEAHSQYISLILKLLITGFVYLSGINIPNFSFEQLENKHMCLKVPSKS